MESRRGGGRLQPMKYGNVKRVRHTPGSASNIDFQTAGYGPCMKTCKRAIPTGDLKVVRLRDSRIGNKREPDAADMSSDLKYAGKQRPRRLWEIYEQSRLYKDHVYCDRRQISAWHTSVTLRG